MSFRALVRDCDFTGIHVNEYTHTNLCKKSFYVFKLYTAKRTNKMFSIKLPSL